MRTIRLYGALGRRFGRVHKLEVESVSEALRALNTNFKGFSQFVTNYKSTSVGYEVWDGNYNIGAEDTDSFVKVGDRDIKIIPRIIGSGAVAKIVIGIILVIVSWWAGGSAGWAYLGMAIAMSGVTEMMSVKPSSGESTQSVGNETRSYVFSGSTNTTKQGSVVPIAYGIHLLGSQIISASLTTSNAAG